jgi:hypothetical protein
MEHNLRVLISTIPPALLDRNVGELLKSTNHDINTAICQEKMKLMNQANLKTKPNTISQVNTQNGSKI